MSELRFTAEHEWLRQDEEGLITVGITNYAQDALGDVVFVQLPERRVYAAGEEVAVLESVKAASNIAMPLDGEIVELNEALEASPEKVNESPLSEGWFFRFRPADASSLTSLLSPSAYDALIAGQA